MKCEKYSCVNDRLFETRSLCVRKKERLDVDVKLRFAKKIGQL